MTTAADILPSEEFSGAITLDSVQYAVKFSAHAGSNGHLILAPVFVTKDSYLALARGSVVGTSEVEFELNGVSNAGKTFVSKRASVRAHRHDDRGMQVTIAVQEATIGVALEKALSGPLLRRCFRGMSAFPPAHAKTPLGLVSVFGNAHLVDKDELSGGVQLNGDSVLVSPSWRVEAEALLDHMQDGLALAHGGRLHAAIQMFGSGPKAEWTFWAGAGFRAELPVQPHLNLGPLVEALSTRFFMRKPPIADILWAALRWSQVETTIDEVRFLTGMIALEAIADAHLSAPKHTTFANRILALFSFFSVAQIDFAANVIDEMVVLRNKIVHTGVAPNKFDLWKNIILVRELVARILLRQIEFAGTYWCYIGGRHMRQFPSCVPV